MIAGDDHDASHGIIIPNPEEPELGNTGTIEGGRESVSGGLGVCAAIDRSLYRCTRQSDLAPPFWPERRAMPARTMRGARHPRRTAPKARHRNRARPRVPIVPDQHQVEPPARRRRCRTRCRFLLRRHPPADHPRPTQCRLLRLFCPRTSRALHLIERNASALRRGSDRVRLCRNRQRSRFQIRRRTSSRHTHNGRPGRRTKCPAQPPEPARPPRVR